ncbi:hypothetical protein WR25_04767 [Diploscapter pachys]|uniref:Uncharacterized protein n=1 Tax=Diploscapter pachys TaxID=2018661 RepID=A0A2A2JNF0_9BILA|nr:hypothetical protein WR25_04767 [Diploscapter pachys]
MVHTIFFLIQKRHFEAEQKKLAEESSKPEESKAPADDSKKKKMTTRKPSSEKITKDEDQLQGPSSEEGKLVPSLPESASASDSDKSQQPISQDTSVTKRKPSSDKLVKGEDQPQIASSDEPKLIEPKSDATAPSDQSLQPSSQDTTPSDLAQPEDSKKKKVTTRKPSSDKLVKEAEQTPVPSNGDTKSDTSVPSDQSLQQPTPDSESVPPDSGKKKITKRKPSSERISKDGDQEKAEIPPSDSGLKQEPIVAVPGQTSGIVPAVGDESEYTLKISLKDGAQSDSVEGIPADISTTVMKSGDEGEFTAKIPLSKQQEEEESKKKKITKRTGSKDRMKREDSTPSEASGVVPVSQEQTELSAKILLKKSDDGQPAVPGEASTTIPSSGEQPELTAKIPSKKLGEIGRQETVESIASSGGASQAPSDDGSKKKKKKKNLNNPRAYLNWKSARRKWTKNEPKRLKPSD